MKNPQTTIAPTFLTHIISAIDSVKHFNDKDKIFCLFVHDNIQYKASSYRPIEKWLIISKLYDIYLFMINNLTD